MRALLLISGLPTGGAERVTVSFLTCLARHGRPAPLCTLTARHDGPLAGELRQAGVARFDLGSRRLADPRTPLRLARLLRRQHVDVVHAHGQDAAIVAAAIRPFTRARLVITRHVLAEPAHDARERLRAGAALRAFRLADAVVAVSRAAAERLAALASIPLAEIRVLPNGVELDRFEPAKLGPWRERVRAELNVTASDPLVLMPAVMREGKGHDVMLEAAATLRARVPGIRILLAGDGELEPDLRRRARALQHTITFLGRRTDIPDLMAACDLVVLPSDAEALPTVLIEAAAAARPVVATRVGGTPEVVRDGETGVLVPSSEPAALADTIAALLADRGRLEAMGRAGYRLAREEYGIDRQVQRTVELWETLAGGGAR